MSATKPSPGYDDRFVVPLEPSRRGAHRARVSPVVGVLPTIAVVTVVAVVIVLAWALFGRSGDSSGPVASTGTLTIGQSVQASPVPGDAVSTPAEATTRTPSASSTTGGEVDKTVSVTVLNSTSRNGLASRVSSNLVNAGWTSARVSTMRVSARPTTVYYTTADQKATVDVLLTDLEAGAGKRSTAFGTTGITVVLGTDYP